MQGVAMSTIDRFAGAPPRLSAVVTDLDGVLCDTETVLVVAINRFLAEEAQAPLTHDEARTMTGFDNDSWWRRIRELRPTLTTPLEEYTRRVDMIARTPVPRGVGGRGRRAGTHCGDSADGCPIRSRHVRAP